MHTIKISVRNLVEFILRSGDLISSESGLADPDAMLEGTRIHKKLQKRMGSGYRSEVALTITTPVSREGIDLEITVEGRADGIFSEKDGVIIDEIKGVYHSLSRMREPVAVHRAQAMCYGYMYVSRENLKDIGIRMTYCHIPTEEIRYFSERISRETLHQWFMDLMQEYAKWIIWEIKWQEKRNESIRQINFPFHYREGQYTLVKGVYQSILREKRLYIQAPTGVGKTLSTVFPAVKSMGEGITEKIFYLTAKTITRTVARESFCNLAKQKMSFKHITLTAKEKICILEKPHCNPSSCPRALGHFDRINEAVFDVITHEDCISREVILSYAQKHQVCPFEMSLDVSTWCDAIIGDYNYVFDPTASLKRFFSQETKQEYVYLIDEAHNLVDRAREMYSAMLVKEEFLFLKKLLSPHSSKLSRCLEGCNKFLLSLKRECEEFRLYEPVEIEPFIIKLLRLSSLLEEILHDNPRESSSKNAEENAAVPLAEEDKERILNFYFQLRNFLTTYEILDDKYTIYADYDDDECFRLHLQCMDPSSRLDYYLKKGRCAIFFSATLLPVRYYQEQLAGREDDYAIYAPSPFPSSHRCIMVGRDVSSKYSQRGPAGYQLISDYIMAFCRQKTGNYLVFFPSYRMMNDVNDYLANAVLENKNCNIYTQKNNMSEEEREEFLSHFQPTPSETTVGLCVMGGIFGEGIDLTGDRLIGTVIVGTGLPMVCSQKELFRKYFDHKKGAGFDYAYRYPGMNKVLQAAGRVIRTMNDHGAVLLLDQRFLQQSYQKLFPREWFPYEVVDLNTMPEHLRRFWDTSI